MAYWSNCRGQQIGEYGIIIGVVATVFISSQMIISNRVGSAAANVSTTILGSAAPLNAALRADDDHDNTFSVNDSFSWVEERGTPGSFRTRVHSENTGNMHSGFVLAEAPGPHLGPIFEFDRGESSALSLAGQLCEEFCSKYSSDKLDLDEFDKDEDGWFTVTFRRGKDTKTIRFKIKDFSRNVDGVWNAEIDFLGEDGKIHSEHFVGAPESEWNRLMDWINGDYGRALRGIAVDQLSEQLGPVWEYLEERSELYEKELDDGGLLGDIVRFFVGDGGEEEFNPENLRLEDLADEGLTVNDLLNALDKAIAKQEEALRNPEAPARVNLRKHADMSEEEAAALISGDLEQSVFTKQVIEAMVEALGIDPSKVRASALPGLLTSLSEEQWEGFMEVLEPVMKTHGVSQATLELYSRAIMLGEDIGWDQHGGGQLFADNESDNAGDYHDDQNTIRDQGEAILQFLYGSFREARSEYEEALRASGLYSPEEITQELSEKFDQPSKEIEGLVAEALRESGSGVQQYKHGVPEFDDEGNYVGASWEKEPPHAIGVHHPDDPTEAKGLAEAGSDKMDEAYKELVQAFVCQYDCSVEVGEGKSLVDHDEVIRALLNPLVSSEDIGVSSIVLGKSTLVPDGQGGMMAVPVGDALKSPFEGYYQDNILYLGDQQDGTFISDQTRQALQQSGMSMDEFRAFLGAESKDQGGPVYDFPTAKKLEQLSGGEQDPATALLKKYLKDHPIAGPRGQPIDVAVGGEYDVLTDMVRTAGGEAEQIIWKRVGGEEGLGTEEGTPGHFLSQVPEGKPVGITQREDQYMTPVEMGWSGRTPHPRDVPHPDSGEPGARRMPGAFYPEDYLMMRRNPDAVLPEDVESQGGSGSFTRPGSRDEPNLGGHAPRPLPQ